LASSSASRGGRLRQVPVRAARRRKDRGGAHPGACEAPGADTSAYENKEKKYIVCVSSQAGCALACAFCATGELGFQRNLQAAEIVGQVLAVRAEADRPVRGVVFMGMGEPFLNYDEVIRAARILCHPSGACIDARSITVSTRASCPRSAASPPRAQVPLAVSLTHAVARKRLPLMPIEKVHPSSDLVAALHDHARAAGRACWWSTFCSAGSNDSPDDARALCGLLDPKLVKIDLIDVNGTTGGFQRTTRQTRSGVPGRAGGSQDAFAIRYSGGQDVGAGCGQLVAGGSRRGARLS